MTAPTPLPDALWTQFLSAIEGTLSRHVLETWLRPVRCTAFNPNAATVTLEVRDQFTRDWLNDHYYDFIRNGLSDRLGETIAIDWVLNADLAEPEVTQTPDNDHMVTSASPRAMMMDDEPSRVAEAALDDSSRFLNQRYRFSSFVCGPSNELALAAARAVSEKPGQSYNPLFLYGRVGLGKTHLLSAIGHHVRQTHPRANVVYCSAEQFTNEVVKAVLGNKLEDFRRKYRRRCDVLLIDDIQLIAGKERTQHEFFHIFNTLYDSARQIVVTSDKLPHEIPDIEDRLRNRFQFGLIADIQSPETETRVAIVRRKAMDEGMHLPDDVAFFLAENVRSNVRELEGALVRLMAHSSLTGRALSASYAHEVLSDIMSCRSRELSVESIQQTVADFFHVRTADINGRRRHKTLVRPRQVAMYLARKHTGASFPDLGHRFGNKDHTTVMSACKRVETMKGADSSLTNQLQELERQLNVNDKN